MVQPVLLCYPHVSPLHCELLVFPTSGIKGDECSLGCALRVRKVLLVLASGGVLWDYWLVRYTLQKIVDCP